MLRRNYGLPLLTAAIILLGSTIIPPKGLGSASKYEEVLAALQGGRAVEALSDLNRCAVANGNGLGPSIQGGLRINNYIVSPQGIAFSDVHQTLDASGHPVTEYIRYRLDHEGKVVVRIAKLTAGAPEAISQGEYICHLPEGVDFVW